MRGRGTRAPHIGEGMGPGEREEEEYEDVEARAADADEVRSWLQHLGLAEHAYTFEAHEIDLEVLLELQEHDLRDMGVHDPTQRMQLLRGIGVLRARGALSALGRAPGDRIFRDRYRLGAEVNFGGAPAVLALPRFSITSFSLHRFRTTRCSRSTESAKEARSLPCASPRASIGPATCVAT